MHYVVLWVKILQTEMMMEICSNSKGTTNTIGKLVPVKNEINAHKTDAKLPL